MTTRLRRREVLAASGSTSLLALAGCSGLLGGDAADGWPMYQYGPAHTGAHPSAEGPGDTLDEQWTTSARSLAEEHGDEVSSYSVSPPVVSDGTVFVTLTSGRQQSFGASLVAMDASNGNQQWQTIVHEDFTETTNGPLPQPTVLGDVVVASLSGSAPGPSVIAVDADSGEVQWRNSEPMTVTPGTVWDGTVAFGHSTAHALASDGSLTWEYSEGEEPPFVPVNAPPTIMRDGVYLATVEGDVHAVDHDGNQMWTRDLAFTTEPYSTPTAPTMPVAGDSLFVTTLTRQARGDGRLVALDPEDGSARWHFKPNFNPRRRERLLEEFEGSERLVSLGVGIFTPPALHDGTLYALGRKLPERDQPRAVPHLFAVDASTGDQRWATRLPRHFISAPPVIAGGTVYVLLEAGVVAIDADSGVVHESVEFDDIATGLAPSGDRLFVAKPNEILALGP